MTETSMDTDMKTQQFDEDVDKIIGTAAGKIIF